MKALHILALCALLPLSACNGWQGNNGGCIDDGDCEGTSVCDQTTSSCREVGCLNSSECPLGNHCDESIHTCLTGCAEDDDCLAGETCGATGQCEAYGCRTTELDCHYGEICDATSTCIDASGHHCEELPSYVEELDCMYTWGGVPACFGEIVNNTCQGSTYCLLPCTAGGEECPRGTDCYAPFQGDSRTFCTGDCPFLNDNGF